MEIFVFIFTICVVAGIVGNLDGDGWGWFWSAFAGFGCAAVLSLLMKCGV